MVVLLCTTSGGGGGSTGSTMWMDTNETNVVVGAVIRLFEGGFREGKARKKRANSTSSDHPQRQRKSEFRM